MPRYTPYILSGKVWSPTPCPRQCFHLCFLPDAHRSADFVKWNPTSVHPIYLSFPESPAGMFVRFLNRLLRIALRSRASLASAPQANRRHDGTVDQSPIPTTLRVPILGRFICRAFDARQAQALAPAHAARLWFVYPSWSSRLGRQPVTQLTSSAYMLAASRRISCCQSAGWGHG